MRIAFHPHIYTCAHSWLNSILFLIITALEVHKATVQKAPIWLQNFIFIQLMTLCRLFNFAKNRYNILIINILSYLHKV